MSRILNSRRTASSRSRTPASPKGSTHTDYSNGRKDPLKRDLRVSSPEEQILALFEDAIADNVKNGWKEAG